jgi:hypothetical protein
MNNLKKFADYVSERFGDYSPKINNFKQSNPNGLAGTYEPKNKTIDPDDQIKVGHKRFLKSFKEDSDSDSDSDLSTGNKIIDGEKPKRKRRKGNKIKYSITL